jgi:ferritin-like metal-binding protein YciE
MQEDYQHINTLNELMEYKVRNFVVSENELVQAMEKWALEANSVKLKTIIQKYIEYIHEHINKLDSFNKEMNITSIGINHKVIGSMIEDTNNLLRICMDSVVRDACLLSCIQTINHYKISFYGTLAAYAEIIKLDKYKFSFYQAEVNEKKIDDRLTQLAEFEINMKAIMPFVIEK